jgi:hypothetical protein
VNEGDRRKKGERKRGSVQERGISGEREKRERGEGGRKQERERVYVFVMNARSGNTSLRERLSTVDPLIKLARFGKKNFQNIFL